MSYLHFNELNNPGFKTRIWEVTNNTNDCILGIVRWRASWRKYVYLPVEGTLYDPNCIRDIANFMDEQTRHQKKKYKEGCPTEKAQTSISKT